jgi:hypothetical protein
VGATAVGAAAFRLAVNRLSVGPPRALVGRHSVSWVSLMSIMPSCAIATSTSRAWSARHHRNSPHPHGARAFRRSHRIAPCELPAVISVVAPPAPTAALDLIEVAEKERDLAR